jgi:hypothetical protein
MSVSLGMLGRASLSGQGGYEEFGLRGIVFEYLRWIYTPYTEDRDISVLWISDYV